MLKITVRTPSQIVAAVPFLLRFQPSPGDLVLLNLSGGPSARVDIPDDDSDLAHVGLSLALSLGRSPRADMIAVAYTDDIEHAEHVARVLTVALSDVQTIRTTFVAHGDMWHDLTTGHSGPVTQTDRDMIAAEAVASGVRLPNASRTAHGSGLDAHDTEPVARALTLTQRLSGPPQPTEGPWISQRLSASTYDGRFLSDSDAARVVTGLTDAAVREHVMNTVTREAATELLPVLTNLTSRTPEAHRSPIAALTAFAAWRAGDGALAWMALDKVTDPTHPLANIVAGLLETATDPRTLDGPQ